MTREESIEFYKTYSRKLFNLSFRIVGDGALAEEIMQDTVLKFIRFEEMEETLRFAQGDSQVAQGDTTSALTLATGRTQPQRSWNGLGRGQVAGRKDFVAGRKAVEGWLVRTCVRGSIDALRRLKREREFLGEYAVEEAPEYFAPVEIRESPSDTSQRSGAGMRQESSGGDSGRITVEEVKKAMGKLPSPYRLILTMVLIDGLDYEEISEITGEKEGALRTRFSRARKMLAERLKEGR